MGGLHIKAKKKTPRKNNTVQCITYEDLQSKDDSQRENCYPISILERMKQIDFVIRFDYN